MSNTAGVLAGVFGTAATGYILKNGSWDEVPSSLTLSVHTPKIDIITPQGGSSCPDLVRAVVPRLYLVVARIARVDPGSCLSVRWSDHIITGHSDRPSRPAAVSDM